jgi:hypothetical protein
MKEDLRQRGGLFGQLEEDLLRMFGGAGDQID